MGSDLNLNAQASLIRKAPVHRVHDDVTVDLILPETIFCLRL